MTEESAQQQCYADKAEANTKSPRPDARSVFVCVCVWTSGDWSSWCDAT